MWSESRRPLAGILLFDDRLLHPAFQPPGGWGHANLVFAGSTAVPGRTYARQLRAIGGTVVVRRIHDDRRGAPEVPAGAPVGGPAPLPAAPLPLP